MKLDLSVLPPEGFIVTEHLIVDEVCKFVRPRNNFFDWTESLTPYRSSVWNSAGDLISGSFMKFFNLEEKPAIHPFSGNIDGCTVVEKMDGSTLVVSRYKGEWIIRTRGTMDARLMPNGDEIDYFCNVKYKDFFKTFEGAFESSATLLFEWTSPRNVIVVKASEPNLTLLAIVSNAEYLMTPQSLVDGIASRWNFSRPKSYGFSDVGTLLENVKNFDGNEGVCLYYNNDQNIRKVKSAWYLKRHAFRSQCSFKTLIGMYMHYASPSYLEFNRMLLTDFDYETLQLAQPLIDDLYKIAIEPAVCMVGKIARFVEDNKELEAKPFALKLIEEFKEKTLQSIGFALRKELKAEKMLRDYIEQLLQQSQKVLDANVGVEE